MAQRRKKTRDDSDQGQPAGKKKTRARKGRPAPAEPPAVEAAPSPARELPQVPLPGEFHRRDGQWWWQVQLPGEAETLARPLVPEGEQVATSDNVAAGKIAFHLWEQAIRENVARQIKLESTEKIERLKAQFLDKVRHFTELMETANTKLEAEEKARAAAEAKLAQMTQAAVRKTEDAGQRTDGPGQLILPTSVIAPEAPSTPASALVAAPVSQPQPEPPAAVKVVPPAAPAAPPVETGVCECCGATGIALTHLTRIDSGQTLCPRCLTALRTDVDRLDVPA